MFFYLSKYSQCQLQWSELRNLSQSLFFYFFLQKHKIHTTYVHSLKFFVRLNSLGKLVYPVILRRYVSWTPKVPCCETNTWQLTEHLSLVQEKLSSYPIYLIMLPSDNSLTFCDNDVIYLLWILIMIKIFKRLPIFYRASIFHFILLQYITAIL